MPGSQASVLEISSRRFCLNPRIVIVVAAALMLGSIAAGQNPPEPKPQTPAVPPDSELASTLARRLSDDLHVKTAVGEPIKAGSVTLIPILMIDVGFGGGGMAAPGGAAGSQNPPAGGDGFVMSGEARPLGFVAIGKKGTRFISVAQTPAK
jgi:uncharacterized spore protein YtfJ